MLLLALFLCIAPDEDEDEDEEVPDDTSILSDEDRQTIVDQHNHHRRNTNPSAADMMKMVYERALQSCIAASVNKLNMCTHECSI